MSFISLTIWPFTNLIFGFDMINNRQLGDFGQILFPLRSPGLADNPESVHCIFSTSVDVKSIRFKVGHFVLVRRQFQLQMLFN